MNKAKPDVTIIIPGKPNNSTFGHRGLVMKHNKCNGTGCKKCRLTGYISTINTYAKHGNERDAIKKALRHSGLLPDAIFKGPIYLLAVFYMPIPKSWPKYKQAEAQEGKVVPLTIPDLTSLHRFSEDVLSGLVYEDDKQVVEMHCQKWYDVEPKTEIIVKELDPIWLSKRKPSPNRGTD